MSRVLFFVFWKVRPNLRGGNSYHSSFDDPLGKGAALKADVTLQKCQIKAGNQECFEKLHLHYFQSLIHPLFWNSAASSPSRYVTVDRTGSQLKINWHTAVYSIKAVGSFGYPTCCLLWCAGRHIGYGATNKPLYSYVVLM